MPVIMMMTTDFCINNNNIIVINLPVIHHELVHKSRAPRRWGRTYSSVNVQLYAFNVCMHFEWGMSKTSLFNRHFIIKDTPLPVMCGALLVSCMRYGVLDIAHLWGSPLNGYFSSMRDIVIGIRKITCHPKICNLGNKICRFVNRNQIVPASKYILCRLHLQTPGCS